ncbi:MAG: C40 family peptidase [Clostridiales bacterium]|nr:C40 family peptidase [Clostridiales bacterium]MBR6254962.1 C40 family peptidase [Clostridiales bacterium]
MQQRKKKNRSQRTVVTIAVCTMATFPLLMIPTGLNKGTPAGVRVARAYEEAFREEEKEGVLVEEWALPPIEEPGEEGKPLTEGALIPESYIPGKEHTEKKYDGYMTAQIEQTFDSSDLPIEMLDTDAFESTYDEMYISTNKTILKEIPNMDSTTVADIDRSTKVIRIARGSTWSLVKTEDGRKGYLLNKSLSNDMVFNDIDRTVWVDAWDLKLREEPSTDSRILKILDKNTKLHCSAVAIDQWYRVELEDGTKGYVYVSYTTTNPPPTPTPKPTPKPKATPTPKPSSGSHNDPTKAPTPKPEHGGGSGGGSGDEGGGSGYVPPEITGRNGESIVNIAKSMLGVKYTWQGETREGGVDCSGLVVYCYRQLRAEVPHQSNLIRDVGDEVSREDVRLGDIFVYDLKYGDGIADHVAIYAGDGKVIHASYSRGQVVWGNADMGKILTIRRIFG